MFELEQKDGKMFKLEQKEIKMLFRKREKKLGGWFWVCVVLAVLNIMMYATSFHWYNLGAGLFAGFAACWIAFERLKRSYSCLG